MDLNRAAGVEYDLESIGSVFSSTASQRQQINSTSIYRYGIMLVLEGGGFCIITCTAVVQC